MFPRAKLCGFAVSSKKNHSQVLPTYENFCVLGVVGSKISCLSYEKGITLRLKILTRSKEVKGVKGVKDNTFSDLII